MPKSAKSHDTAALLRDLIEAIGRLELLTKKLRAVIGVIVEEVELADVGETGGDSIA